MKKNTRKIIKAEESTASDSQQEVSDCDHEICGVMLQFDLFNVILYSGILYLQGRSQVKAKVVYTLTIEDYLFKILVSVHSFPQSEDTQRHSDICR